MHTARTRPLTRINAIRPNSIVESTCPHTARANDKNQPPRRRQWSRRAVFSSPLQRRGCYMMAMMCLILKRTNRSILFFSHGPISIFATALSTSSRTLSDQLLHAYQSRETDGILRLVKETHPSLLTENDPNELFLASLSAATTPAGQTRTVQLSGTVNALIASCVQPENGNSSDLSDTANGLLESFDAYSEELGVFPDIVTLSCAYAATAPSNLDLEEEEPSSDILSRATQFAKKRAGTKRRKLLASSRRRPPPPEDKDEVLRDRHDLEVLFENEHYIGLNKPSGMVCYHKRKTTKGKVSKKGKKNTKDLDISLEDALLSLNIPLSTLNPEAMGVVHRIDRGTSGCVVVAKHDAAHARLLTEFFRRTVNKEYLTLVPRSDEDDANLSQGVLNGPVGGRPASSEYNVDGVYEDHDGVGIATLLKVKTETGRKHQVRLHCARGLGRPVFLDDLYFEDTEGVDWKVPDSIKALEGDGASSRRFFLHAKELMLPEFGIKMDAPVPDWWGDATKGWRTRS